MFETVVRFICEKFARKLPTWVIETEGDPYLARHYIFRKDWIPDRFKRFLGWVPSVFVHEFQRGDMDDEVHNHPWKLSCSLILAGGYIEERAFYKEGRWSLKSKTFRPGMINVISDHDFHRVALLEGKTTWTLFVAGPQTGQSWGFLDIPTGEFVPWREFVARRDMTAYAKRLIDRRGGSVRN